MLKIKSRKSRVQGGSVRLGSARFTSLLVVLAVRLAGVLVLARLLLFLVLFVGFLRGGLLLLVALLLSVLLLFLPVALGALVRSNLLLRGVFRGDRLFLLALLFLLLYLLFGLGFLFLSLALLFLLLCLLLGFGFLFLGLALFLLRLPLFLAGGGGIFGVLLRSGGSLALFGLLLRRLRIDLGLLSLEELDHVLVLLLHGLAQGVELVDDFRLGVNGSLAGVRLLASLVDGGLLPFQDALPAVQVVEVSQQVLAQQVQPLPRDDLLRLLVASQDARLALVLLVGLLELLLHLLDIGGELVPLLGALVDVLLELRLLVLLAHEFLGQLLRLPSLLCAQRLNLLLQLGDLCLQLLHLLGGLVALLLEVLERIAQVVAVLVLFADRLVELLDAEVQVVVGLEQALLGLHLEVELLVLVAELLLHLEHVLLGLERVVDQRGVKSHGTLVGVPVEDLLDVEQLVHAELVLRDVERGGEHLLGRLGCRLLKVEGRVLGVVSVDQRKEDLAVIEARPEVLDLDRVVLDGVPHPLEHSVLLLGGALDALDTHAVPSEESPEQTENELDALRVGVDDIFRSTAGVHDVEVAVEGFERNGQVVDLCNAVLRSRIVPLDPLAREKLEEVDERNAVLDVGSKVSHLNSSWSKCLSHPLSECLCML